MVRLDRIEFIKLLVAAGGGMVAGNVARNSFGDPVAGILASVVALVIVYGVLDIVDRRYLHRNE